ncbi:MAG: radical SAM protein, partial [Candidatus Electrothrix sp. AUS4]|nr:radical SAM protein [Candidatus Electrothrix sp. AUS4]
MAGQPEYKQEYKFSDIIAAPAIKERWEKVRKYFFLRESTYDMTNRCNVRCEGCYYYNGEKQFAQEMGDEQAWRQLFETEKERGITFVVLAGAEPSLVPELCAAAYKVIPHGAIASNGLKPLPREIDYRIHISVWGNDQTSLAVRKAPDMLARQMKNYAGDPRAVFVYTFTSENINDAREVTELLAKNKQQITFNMFSAPVGYTGPLRHTPASLEKTRKVMLALLTEYPETVLFSPYNIVTHTHEQGLHALFSCPYPRMNPSTDIGLGRSFRQYRTDLQWDRDAACCVPDTDCADCRHYAAGSAVVTARMYRHATDPTTFSAWLDYVDTYLSVWVRGYEKGANL